MKRKFGRKDNGGCLWEHRPTFRLHGCLFPLGCKRPRDVIDLFSTKIRRVFFINTAFCLSARAYSGHLFSPMLPNPSVHMDTRTFILQSAVINLRTKSQQDLLYSGLFSSLVENRQSIRYTISPLTCFVAPPF